MEYNSGSPIYLQVINELKKKMVKGELKPGEKMPSNRELAVLYKVNQNTAARIYREMGVGRILLHEARNRYICVGGGAYV